MFTSLASDDVCVSSLIGQPVVNEAGDRIGHIDDLIMDKQGHLSAALIEVGGFIGVQEKLVAIPFGSLSIDLAAGKPRIVAELSRPYLAEAPLFKPPERSSLEQLKDTAAAIGATASELGHRAADAASKVAEMATDKASEVGRTLADRGPDLIQKATEKASEVGQKIADKTSELVHKATEKAAEVGQKVAEKTSELTRKVAAPDED